MAVKVTHITKSEDTFYFPHLFGELSNTCSRQVPFLLHKPNKLSGATRFTLWRRARSPGTDAASTEPTSPRTSTGASALGVPG